MTDYLNRRAVEFVEQPHEKPFCLYLGHKAVHLPFLPAKRHEELYSDYEFQVPPPDDEDLAGKPILTREMPRLNRLELEGIGPEPAEPRRGRGRDPQSVVRDQLRCLASVDEGVGQLFEALEASGELDNTIFIYTSDNGFLMGEHGRFNAKRLAYDEALRVPFFIRYPKLIAPGSIREMLMPHARSLSPETCVSDGRAFVKWLDSQASVDTGRKVGTTGYCMTGSYCMRLAAAMPDRIGAGCSFHGGGLATDADDSPHKLAGQMKAEFLIAIAENDDERRPNEKTLLREAFDAAGVKAEIEVYEGALHGWCPPDSAVYHEAQAERAWSRMLKLFERALA